MEKLRDAFRELTNGPPRRRVRIWESLPAMLREEAHSTRRRDRTRVRQTASHLAVGEACLESLGSTPLSELDSAITTGQNRLNELRRAVAALMVRYAARPALPEPLLHELTLALGNDCDPFRCVRNWTEHFTPGRESVPESEIERDLPPVFYQAGLLRREQEGRVRVRRSLLRFLWCGRLRLALQPDNRNGPLAFIQRVAGVGHWTGILVLLAEHLHGTALTSFLQSVCGPDSAFDPVGSDNTRLYRAARCLGQVPTGRIPLGDPTAYTIAQAVATRVLARLQRNTDGSPPTLGPPTPLERALGGCAKWCRIADLRIENLTLEEWIEQIDRNLDQQRTTTTPEVNPTAPVGPIVPESKEQQKQRGKHQQDYQRRLAMVRRAPELFATQRVLNGLAVRIRELPPVLDSEDEWLRPEARMLRPTDALEGDAAEYRARGNLGRIGDLLAALQPASTQEPVLGAIADGLVNQNGGLAGRMASVASCLAPVEVTRFALEPLLITLAHSTTHTPTQRNCAVAAAGQLGSIHPLVLDQIHKKQSWPESHNSNQRLLVAEREPSEGRERSRRSRSVLDTFLRLHYAMEEHLLDRLRDSQPPGELIPTLHEFGLSVRAFPKEGEYVSPGSVPRPVPPSPGATPRVVRRLACLIRHPQPSVATAAVDALVVLSSQGRVCRLDYQGRAVVVDALVALSSPSNRTAQEAARQIMSLLTSRSGPLRLAGVRAVQSDHLSSLLTRATLARLIGDPFEEIRLYAVQLARVRFHWLLEQEFLAPLRAALVDGGAGAWLAAVELWKQVDGEYRDGRTEAAESLAGLLSDHDPCAWRRELGAVLALRPTLDDGDDPLWHALADRLKRDCHIPGGTAAWRTPRSVAPDRVQQAIGDSLVRLDAPSRAYTAMRALAPGGPLTIVWNAIVDALGRREHWVRDALQLLQSVAEVPQDVVERIGTFLPPHGAEASLWEPAVEALAALGSPETTAERICGLIEYLSRRGSPFALWFGVRDLLRCSPDTTIRAIADRVLRLSNEVTSGRASLIQFAVVPLAQRENLDCVEYLFGLLHDAAFGRDVTNNLADVFPNLSRHYLRRLLTEFDNNVLPGHLRCAAAREYARRGGAQDAELWQTLAVGEGEPDEIRGLAITLLANARGYWPLSVADVCDRIRLANRTTLGPDVLLDAVIGSLHSVYPLGIPQVVVAAIAEHDAGRIAEIAGRLGPTACARLVGDLAALARIPTTTNRRGILAAFQHMVFRAVPWQRLVEIWECLHDDDPDIRRSAAQLVASRGSGLLSCCDPRLPSVGSELPEWLLPHIQRAMELGADMCAFRAAIHVLRQLGVVADNQEVIGMLTSALRCRERRREATARLAALGYLIDENEQQMVPLRAARLAGNLGC